MGRKLEAAEKSLEEQLLFEQAREAWQDAREAGAAGADGGPQLYQRAFQLFQDLYNRSPNGERGDQCLWAIRVLSWDLWQMDRERFPISLGIDFAKELVRRNLDSAEEWDTLSSLYQNASAWPEAMRAAKRVGLYPLVHPGRVPKGLVRLGASQ